MRMVLLVTLLGSLMVAAQDAQVKKVPVTPTPINSGKQMFVAYCAPCHGTEGKGNGPAAAALKVAPRDLTQLAKKNGGKYPSDHVTAVIRAVDSPAHGSKEMPIWGELLYSVSSSDAEVQLRISNLVRYVGTLQEK